MTDFELTGCSVLALFPHPDDEAYSAAGTLALCARTGSRVQIVCATRGEAGEDHQSLFPPGPELSRLRTRELERSCEILGILPPIFLDWPDSGIEKIATAAGSARIAELLHETQPQVVITLGKDGVYANRDHLALTRMVTAAVTYQRLLYTQFPRGYFQPLWRFLKKNWPQIIAEIEPDGLGCERQEVDLVVDITEVSDLKLAAIEAHKSQLPGGSSAKFLVPGLVNKLLNQEWFSQAARLP